MVWLDVPLPAQSCSRRNGGTFWTISRSWHHHQLKDGAISYVVPLQIHQQNRSVLNLKKLTIKKQTVEKQQEEEYECKEWLMLSRGQQPFLSEVKVHKISHDPSLLQSQQFSKDNPPWSRKFQFQITRLLFHYFDGRSTKASFYK